jgi:hypothetical protein
MRPTTAKCKVTKICRTRKRALITHSQTIRFIIQIINKGKVMALLHDVRRLIHLFIHVARSGKMQFFFFYRETKRGKEMVYEISTEFYWVLNDTVMNIRVPYEWTISCKVSAVS